MSASFRLPRRDPVSDLPPPDPAALELSEQLQTRICHEIEAAGGRISFDHFMELALYAPGLGYYVAGSRKFGEAGDFVTAPEVSPLFAQCIAHQAAELLGELPQGDILEFGAGSGVLAVDLLAELERLGQLPNRYLILELSPELQQRQQQILREWVPQLLERVSWLSQMPSRFEGFVLANELLDAMPASRFRHSEAGIEEGFVVWQGEGFRDHFARPETAGFSEQVKRRLAGLPVGSGGYVSELNLRLGPWFAALGGAFKRGAVLLIDYGYPRSEYYHPQRSEGTLMCHYRHRAHADPYRWPGLQDITAQVDFTAVAEAAEQAGFALAGYTTQAHFLMASGLDELLAGSDPDDIAAHMARVQGVKKLTLPSEMGERFKVIGFTKQMKNRMRGFGLLDLRGRL
jgi:SAM-dependent MidA family methyltransferase